MQAQEFVFVIKLAELDHLQGNRHALHSHDICKTLVMLCCVVHIPHAAACTSEATTSNSFDVLALPEVVSNRKMCMLRRRRMGTLRPQMMTSQSGCRKWVVKLTLKKMALI